MISTFRAKFIHKPIDEVRDHIIGCRITDIEHNGEVFTLENDLGEKFVIDATGNTLVASAIQTDKERMELLEDLFDALLEKLNVSEDDLLEILQG